MDWRPDDAWLDIYEITRTALRIRREHPALRQRHWFEGRPTIVGGPKDLAWIHPTGREMTGDDWDDTRLHVIGMFVSGDPMRDPGPRGEQQHDSSFLLWLNGSAGRLRGHAPREQVGPARRGRALHRPGQPDRHRGARRRQARDRPAVAGVAAADVGGGLMRPPATHPYASVTTPSSAGLARYACLGRTRTV